MVKTNELFRVQYVAPKVKEFEVKVQKVICDSPGLSIEDYSDDEEELSM